MIRPEVPAAVRVFFIMYKLVDFKTKKLVRAKNFVFTGSDGPWEVVMDLDVIKKKLNRDYFRKQPPFVSKYLPFLPIKNYSSLVSLQEGSTPLIRSKKIGPKMGINLYFKYEAQNPTGSFKDRGSAVELTIAKELGAKAIVVASTGNMAASCSCYAAAAGIPCFVFVPEGTPQSKLAQVISYGGKIVQIKGSYNDAANLAKFVAERLSFYLAGDYAFRVEGQKTAAFEIIDQLLYQIPDMVFVPIGCGTNITTYGKGFTEYKSLGIVDRVPKMMGVQAEGADSLVQSYEKQSKSIQLLQKTNTIASAIAVTFPLDGVKALDTIYNTQGQALRVSDREILEAQYDLSKEEGIFVESSSAASLAALVKLSKRKSLKNQRIVCVLTGNGLKDPLPILKVAIKPPTIYPDIDSFLSLYNHDFFKGKNVVFYDKETLLFSKSPNNQKILTTTQKLFGIKLMDFQIKEIKDKVDEFLKKGKDVTFSDYQDILQDILEKPTRSNKKVFEVLDFHVETSKDEKPKAEVIIRMNGTKIRKESTGVGPVDAVINALKKATGGKIKFVLTDYRVEIRSGGTGAVVFVDLRLTQNGNTSIGQGTSPDIIQASIEAFEHAYNGFRH